MLIKAIMKVTTSKGYPDRVNIYKVAGLGVMHKTVELVEFVCISHVSPLGCFDSLVSSSVQWLIYRVW